MSMDLCFECEMLVDTDEDPDAYYLEDNEGNLITQNVCRCVSCRREKEKEYYGRI